MTEYVGLDVSSKEVSVCVVDAKGGVRRRAVLPTDPERIAAFVAAEAPQTERVVHESGILSTWLTQELERRSVSILCIDARLAHKVLSARLNKSDKADAESLAQLARTGWLTRVHIRSEASNHLRAPVGARERPGCARRWTPTCAAY